MKYVLSAWIALLAVSATARAAQDALYAAKTVKIDGRSVRIEERGSTLFFRAPDYELSLRDTDSDNFYDEKVLRKGKLEMRFFRFRSGEFQNLEIRERRRSGVLYTLFYRKGREYKLLEAQLRPYRTYFQGVPILGRAYQACRGEIEDYAKQHNLDWKSIIGALNENEMLGYLRSLDIIDQSCDRGKFKDSGEIILRSVASVLATYKAPESRYLGCLERRRLSSLADSFMESILKSGKGGGDESTRIRIHCRPGALGDEVTTGSFDSRKRVLYFHEAYDKQKDNEGKKISAEIAKKLYARTFFHESLHACGMEDEGHVHDMEDCCSDGSREETEQFCQQADDATAREHRVVTYATAFSRYLPGFDDFWRELVSFKDTQAEKDIFDHFIVGSDKIFRVEHEKLAECTSAALKNFGPNTQAQVDKCYQESFKRSYEAGSTILNEVCDRYFDNEKLSERRRAQMKARCQSFQVKLREMLKRGYEEECSTSDLDGGNDKCIRVAMAEAMSAYSRAPDATKTYEKMAEARRSDKMRYLNSLYQAIDRSTPKLEEFRKQLEKILIDGFPGDLADREKEAKRHAREQQALLIYRYLGLLDRSFPRSDAGGLSFQCREGSKENSRDCERKRVERKRVERVNEMFFRYVCVSSIAVEEPEKACASLREGMESVWKDVLDRCPTKNDPSLGFQCYQNVFAMSVQHFSEPGYKEGPAFAYTFWDKENPTKEEVKLLQDFELTAVERAYLGALKQGLKGGKAFLEQAITDVDTAAARRILQYYVRYLRAKETGEGPHKLYEECAVSNAQEQEKRDCEGDALQLFRKNSEEYFGKMCPVFFSDEDGDACATIGALAKGLIDDNSRPPGCKAGSGETFACINKVYERAGELWQDPSRNKFSWEELHPLRRSKDHMKDLIVRLDKEERDKTKVDFQGTDKPESRIRIDFSDYDRMRQAALAAEDRVGPLGELGRRAADEAAKLGIPDAHADDKVAKQPAEELSQVTEGRRFYGSEANPWSSRGDNGQEPFQPHRARDVPAGGRVRESAEAPEILKHPKLPGPPRAEEIQETGASREPASQPIASSVARVPLGGEPSQETPAPVRGGGGDGGGVATSSAKGPAANMVRSANRMAATKSTAAAAPKTADPGRAPATREAPVDAATLTLTRRELIEFAKTAPKDFIARLKEAAFVSALKFHKVLVIVSDRSYGSLDSVTVLKFEESKGGFEVLRLGDEE